MEWQEPFITYGAGTITEDQIQEVAKKYSALLDQNTI
jgi:putative NADPH-quinone reductase